MRYSCIFKSNKKQVSDINRGRKRKTNKELLCEAEKIYDIIVQYRNITERQLAFIFGKTVTTVQGIIPVVKLLYHDVIARNNPRQYCIKSSYGEIPDKILGIKALQHFKYKQKILNLLKNTSGLSCREITEYLSVGTQEKIRALLYELRKEKKIYLKKVRSNKWIYLHMDNYVEEDE